MTYAGIAAVMMLCWTLVGIMMSFICNYIAEKNGAILADLNEQYRRRRIFATVIGEDWKGEPVRSSAHQLFRQKRDKFRRNANFFMLFSVVNSIIMLLVCVLKNEINSWVGFY